MIIKPMIRSNICINAHPAGCAAEVDRQIAYVREKAAEKHIEKGKLKAALVLGCSTGYGLASRITAAFEYGASTVGVSFEKEGTESRGGTPGWYNNLAFDRAAADAELPSVTINGDAFSDEVKARVIETAKIMGITFDLVVYSLASPVRTDPETGELYKSVLKPFGKPYSGQTVDPMTGKLSSMSAEPATEEEAAQTVKVMGGEDWELWITQLSDANILSDGCITVAYSYIGPALSHAIYRDGTIGGAKKHLEKTAREMDAELKKDMNGQAFVSINKGLVTRSSAVIPIIPLYLSVLFAVMKERGTHEGCIEQIERLFTERLYTGGPVPVDGDHLIRIDDWELDPEVQKEVDRRLAMITEENLPEYADLAGYRHDFLAANGFDVDGIDYEADVARLDTI
ncbi:trans-2-enoyl-CoA reductase family protein [Brucepastera parasyntrophica]|uniref:enoyl-ACP reductase FabV n=1 Tax=Brucepastera parasyntrophica TaxID=2880008 RepID=UPI00210CF2C9|nr:enoyl-ACP reductase FabV [Brucepastera parasyntrophica]ULQ60791.1 trans-2-enoyl-CoA reductase family protein [Brucepastera parasyntrophica]